MSRIREFVSNYLQESTIHGLVYLSRQRSSRTELFFWTCSILASSAIFLLLIFQTSEKLLGYQTVVEIAGKEILVSDIPFPAVTICQDSMVFKEVLQFENVSRNFSVNDLSAYQLFDLLYDQNFVETNNLTFQIKEVMPILRNYFSDNEFDSVTARFRDIEGVPFTQLLTKFGLCLNFNLQPMESLLHIDNVSSDFFYEPPEWFELFRPGRRDTKLPWNVPYNLFGLEFIRQSTSSANIYQPLAGFRIIIHNTDEFPFRTGQHMQHGPGEVFIIGVTPEMMLIDEVLKSWPPEKRSCLMKHEKALKYFKIYTRINCEHECLREAVLQTCGCVPFYMIRSSSDRICGVVDRNCYSKTETNFDFSTCNCLERCDQLSYSLNIHHQRRTERSLFSLKLRKSSFYPSIRYQAFSVSDFLGAVGGLMGLIAGISVFSIIEFTLTIMRCLRFARDSNVTPEAVQRPRPRRRFLVNHDHLFYHLGQNFAEFLKESSIHGVRYTIDKKLKVWERICSAIIVCISVTFCSILIIESLDHLQSNSVSVALGEKIWNVEDIPFPVLSFCPDLQLPVLNEQLDCLLRRNCNVSHFNHLLTKMATIYAGCSICYRSLLERIETSFNVALRASDYKNMSFTDHLEHYVDRHWSDESSFCMDGEPEVGPTEAYAGYKGLCFIINSKDKIFNQESVSQHVSGNYSAKCMHSSRVEHGMTIELRGQKQMFPYNWTKGAIVPINCKTELGVLFVHSKELYFPSEAAWGLHDVSNSLVLTPKITTSDDSLRRLEPKERNCYFEDERKLKYFNKYSKGSCINECCSDTMHEMCHCVELAFVRNNGQRICYEEDRICVRSVLDAMTEESSATFKNCDCLPDCNIVEYTSMLTDIKLGSKNSTKYIDVRGKVPLQGYISIYFGSDEYSGFKRYASYDTVSLLSNIGGFLGLFLGISLLSVIETIYFFTLRFFNNLWFLHLLW